MSVVNLAESRILWKGGPEDRLSRSYWPVGMAVRDCLNWVSYMRRCFSIWVLDKGDSELNADRQTDTHALLWVLTMDAMIDFNLSWN